LNRKGEVGEVMMMGKEMTRHPKRGEKEITEGHDLHGSTIASKNEGHQPGQGEAAPFWERKGKKGGRCKKREFKGTRKISSPVKRKGAFCDGKKRSAPTMRDGGGSEWRNLTAIQMILEDKEPSW